MEAYKAAMPDIDTWVAAGRPHCWVLVETDGDAKCYVTVAHGGIKLVIGDESNKSKQMVDLNRVVALDVDYYGVHKYIWR